MSSFSLNMHLSLLGAFEFFWIGKFTLNMHLCFMCFKWNYSGVIILFDLFGIVVVLFTSFSLNMHLSLGYFPSYPLVCSYVSRRKPSVSLHTLYSDLHLTCTSLTVYFSIHMVFFFTLHTCLLPSKYLWRDTFLHLTYTSPLTINPLAIDLFSLYIHVSPYRHFPGYILFSLNIHLSPHACIMKRYLYR